MVVQRQVLARIGRLIPLAPVPPNAVDLRSGRVGKLKQMLHEVGPIRVAAMLHINCKGYVEVDYEAATAGDGSEVGGGEGGHGVRGRLERRRGFGIYALGRIRTVGCRRRGGGFPFARGAGGGRVVARGGRCDRRTKGGRWASSRAGLPAARSRCPGRRRRTRLGRLRACALDKAKGIAAATAPCPAAR